MKPNLLILMLSGVCAVGGGTRTDEYFNSYGNLLKLEYNGGWNSSLITNVVIYTQYTNTIQLGTNYYRVAWHTNVETTYHIKANVAKCLSSSADSTFGVSSPRQDWWSTYTTNITTTLEQIK